MVTPQKVYFIGNSITDTINQSGLQALAGTQGLVWGRHMIPGASLEWIWEHPSSGFNEQPYGYYSSALTQYAWDGLSLQPFDRPILGEEGDLAIAKNFINLAKAKNPNLQVYLYERWPRKPEDNPNPSADDWDQLWLRSYSGGYQNNESRAYFIQLAQAIQSAYPELKPPEIVPVGDVLYALNQKMKQGQVPGYSSVWQLYSDSIHLTNVGSYIAAVTYYASIYDANPLNLPIPSQYGAIDPQLAHLIEQTAWQVVNSSIGLPNPVVDPNAPPKIFLSDVTVSEGRDAQAVVKVNLSRASDRPITVEYSTVDRSALAGRDYGSTSGTLTFAPGETSQTVRITILDDQVPEADKTFGLKLSNPNNAAIDTELATVTITGTMQSASSIVLPSGIRNLALTGAGNIDGTGNSLNNQITGNSGNNILDGSTGYDTLEGGGGNDTYIVEGPKWDQIIENPNQGTDTVVSIDSEVLGDNLENLTLLGNDNLDGTGNALNNRLAGNRGSNRLDGRAGNDMLLGSSGQDMLIGGLGRDTLVGGSGADRFIFAETTAATASSSFKQPDRIKDFKTRQGDRITLDVDNNIATPNLPRALFNAGPQQQRSLLRAVQAAYADKNGSASGKQRLRSNEAVLLSWRGHSYLSVNLGSRGFSTTQDLFMDLDRMTLPKKMGAIAVTQYFS